MGVDISCCCYDNDAVIALDAVVAAEGGRTSSPTKRTPPHGPRAFGGPQDVVRTDAGSHMPSLMPTILTTSQQKRRQEEEVEEEYEDIAVMLRHQHHIADNSRRPSRSNNTSVTSLSLQHDASISARRNNPMCRRASSSAGGPTSDMAGSSFTTSHNLSSDATRPQSSQSDMQTTPNPATPEHHERQREYPSRSTDGTNASTSPRGGGGGGGHAHSNNSGAGGGPPPHQPQLMHRSGVPLTAVTAEFGFALVPVNPNNVPRKRTESERGSPGERRDCWSPMRRGDTDTNSDGDSVGFGLVDLQVEHDRDARFVAPAEGSSRMARHLSPREDSTITPRRQRQQMVGGGVVGSPSTPMHRTLPSSLGGSLVDAHTSLRRFQGATDSLGLYRSEEEGGYMGRGVGHDVDTPATLDASFGDVFGDRDLEGSYHR